MSDKLLSAASQREFDITMGRAVETDDPQRVLAELEVSFLCDGLDSMVRAGSFAASFLVQSQQGMKATVTDEGFDADTFSLCRSIVLLHEKKIEILRDKERQSEINRKTEEHGAAVAALSGLVDTMLTSDLLNDAGDDEAAGGAGGPGSGDSFGNDPNGNGGGGGSGGKSNVPKLSMLPPLGAWTTADQHRQAWRTRIQQIMEIPNSSLAGRIYFVFISLVVVMSSITSVLETMPVVNPLVNPAYFSLWNALEWFATIVFTLDFVVRAGVHTFDSTLPTAPWQNFFTFIKNPINIIDFITLLPQYIQPLFTGRIVTGNLRTLRMLRLYKVVRRFQGFHRLSLALTRSVSALVGPFAFLAACVFFLSAVLFAAERGDFDTSQDAFLLPDPSCDNQPVSFLGGPIPPGSPCPGKVVSNFVSQWQAFWWCVVTMCTVGYGDFVPVTWVGRLIATITVIVGMVFIAMPIAVIGTNYTIAVQMTSKNDEQDKEDELRRQDQRDTELVGGMAHPGARLLKLLGELIGEPNPAAVAAAAGGGGSSPMHGITSAAAQRNSGMLDLCSPSLNDLNVIEAVLESVVTAKLFDHKDAALPLWTARWPAGVRESSRRKEAVYRTSVISRPLVVHLGSQGRRSDSHGGIAFATTSTGNTTTADAAGGKKTTDTKQHQQQQTATSHGRVGKPSATSSVLETAVSYPGEGNSIPHVVIYDPEIRNALEQAQQMAKQQIEEQRLLGSAGPILADANNNPDSLLLSDADEQQQKQLEDLNKSLPTVLSHHATMCCVRIWGEPTFLVFSSTGAKEATLKTTASTQPVPALDGALLHEQVRGALHNLFQRQLVQSPQSLRSLSGAEAPPSSSASPGADGSGGGGAPDGSSGERATKPSASTSGGSGSNNGSGSPALTPEDLSIESLVFRHSVHKQQQWLALELKPLRVRHGDILSFGAAESPSGTSDSTFLNYRFEDNSAGAF